MRLWTSLVLDPDSTVAPSGLRSGPRTSSNDARRPALWDNGFRGQNVVVGIIDEGVNGAGLPRGRRLLPPELRPLPGAAPITSHGSMCAADVSSPRRAPGSTTIRSWASPRAGRCRCSRRSWTTAHRRDAARGQQQLRLRRRPRPGADSLTTRCTTRTTRFTARCARSSPPARVLLRRRQLRRRLPIRQLPRVGHRPGKVDPRVQQPRSRSSPSRRSTRATSGSGTPPRDPACSSREAGRRLLHPLLRQLRARPPGGRQAPFDNGTSAATPVAAGVAALLLSSSPGVTPDKPRRALLAGLHNVAGQPWDAGYGRGIINAAAAYISLHQ